MVFLLFLLVSRGLPLRFPPQPISIGVEDYKCGFEEDEENPFVSPDATSLSILTPLLERVLKLYREMFTNMGRVGRDNVGI